MFKDSRRTALTAFREPLDVAFLEAAMQDGLVRPVEAQVVLCHLVPERVWVLDGLLVHALIVGGVDVRLDILRQEAVGALGYFTGDVACTSAARRASPIQWSTH